MNEPVWKRQPPCEVCGEHHAGYERAHSYYERYEKAAEKNERLLVYVPRPGHESGIKPGSGIVGRADPRGPLQVYFEGNLFGAENLRTYEERVAHAAGRLLSGYPTKAQRLMGRNALIPVGEWTPKEGFRASEDAAAARELESWLLDANVPSDHHTNGA